VVRWNCTGMNVSYCGRPLPSLPQLITFNDISMYNPTYWSLTLSTVQRDPSAVWLAQLAYVIVVGIINQSINLGMYDRDIWIIAAKQPEKLLHARGREWCIRHGSKSIFGIVRLWPLSFASELLWHSDIYGDIWLPGLVRIRRIVLEKSRQRDFCDLFQPHATLNFDPPTPSIGLFVLLPREPLEAICIKVDWLIFKVTCSQFGNRLTNGQPENIMPSPGQPGLMDERASWESSQTE